MAKEDLKRWRPYIIWASVTLSIKAISPAFSGLKGSLPALFTGILLLYATFIYYWFSGKEMTFLRMVSGKRSLLWFAALALFSSSAYGVTVKILTGHLDLQRLQLLSGTPSLHFWFSSLLLTSLPEELFFRGFLFDHIEGKPALKIVVTALLFCGTHIAVSFTPIRLLTVIPGLFLGFLREKTGEIYTPVLLHTIFNIVHWTIGS